MHDYSVCCLVLSGNLSLTCSIKDIVFILRKNHRNNFRLISFQSKLVERSFLKPYPRIVLTLNADQSADIDTAAKEFLNQTVYVNWPHFIEAKVIQLFDATKKYNGSSNEDNITLNPPEFSTCVDEINSRFEIILFYSWEIISLNDNSSKIVCLCFHNSINELSVVDWSL